MELAFVAHVHCPTACSQTARLLRCLRHHLAFASAVKGRQRCGPGARAQYSEKGRQMAFFSFLLYTFIKEEANGGLADMGRRKRFISLRLCTPSKSSLSALIVLWWGEGESKSVMLA